MFINMLRRTMRSGCGHEGAIRSAGEVRASAPIRALVAIIAALLAVQFMPVTAYADGINAQIISGPSLTPIDNMIGASIAAPDRYIAAALLMGYSPDTISSWDDDIKAKLSNEQTGGSFYTFAQNSVQNYYDVTEHTGIFKTFLDYVGGTFWNMAEALYGNNLWAALYTSQEFESAANDLASILAGENIGGGGGGGDIGSTFQITGADFFYATGVNWNEQYLNNARSRTWNFNLDANALAVISRYKTDYPYIYACAYHNNQIDVRLTNIYILMTKNPVAPVVGGNNVDIGPVECMYYSKSGMNFAHGGTANLSFTSMYLDTSRLFRQSSLYFKDFNPQSVPVPPTQWPDEPSAPSPPDLPEPGTNPTVNPTPWAPVISPTFDFDLHITTEPTTNDLIDWLKKIYYELRSFHGDAHDWFDEVGKGIDGLVDAIDDAQKQIYGELQTIDDTLHDEGQKIRDYMYQMFHWLKDQLNFQNNTFDDNNIVYWLKRIWSKLGSGDINLRPTDPTNEPDDWWDWLVKAVQNFLIGLAATSTELISEIADLASQVMHEFPFSIPWDIAAVLAALSTAPVTPVCTITVPAVDGWWASFDFVIDMSPFDGAAETIRLMEKLLFTGLLIWKSKDLLDFMDVTKWFN